MKHAPCALAALAACACSAPVSAAPATLPEGLVLTGGLFSETAWNLQGGERRTARESGQLAVGATLDTAALASIPGGTVQATITYRWGEELGRAAGLGVLQEIQEIYGRGQTWRLTQLWYDQNLGRGDIKLGRLTPDEDFAAFRCAFVNLSFCGSQPGNLVSDYWYNWPVSEWGARLRVSARRGYVQIGVYEVNRRNLEKTFTAGRLSGASGAMVPAEVGWTPVFGGRPGLYKLGGWFDTSQVNDVRARVGGAPPLRDGGPSRHVDGRGGAYLLAQQQVTGVVRDGQTASGITLFLRAAQADRRTAPLDRQITAGAFWLGPVPDRPRDELGVAVGATHVNRRVARRGFGDDGAEYVAEVFYAARLGRRLTLQPDLQYVPDPGGTSRRDAVVIGLKASATLYP